jgi:hypothetical protein
LDGGCASFGLTGESRSQASNRRKSSNGKFHFEEGGDGIQCPDVVSVDSRKMLLVYIFGLRTLRRHYD